MPKLKSVLTSSVHARYTMFSPILSEKFRDNNMESRPECHTQNRVKYYTFNLSVVCYLLWHPRLACAFVHLCICITFAYRLMIKTADDKIW